MTSWVDARRDKPSAPPIVIPDARSAIRNRLPQSAPHAPEQLAPSTALIRRAATTYCRFRVVSPANAVGVRPTAGFGMTIDCWPRLGANQEETNVHPHPRIVPPTSTEAWKTCNYLREFSSTLFTAFANARKSSKPRWVMSNTMCQSTT